MIASLVGTSIAKEIDTAANKRLRDKSVTRILIADDQRDVLEALRILLKGEGYQTETVTSLAGIFNALEKKEYALLLMDLNYTRDTTSGPEGLTAI